MATMPMCAVLTDKVPRAAALGLCALLSINEPASAVVVDRVGEGASQELFPRPPPVKRQVQFWGRVFGQYPSTTVVVHDADQPDRLIDVIDYKLFSSSAAGTPVPRQERDRVTEQYLKRYAKGLGRFAREGDLAKRHGAIERRLHEVYSASPPDHARLLAGQVNLRAQTGLADEFRIATATARAYLPFMEGVFRRYGVPTRLTRLAFVESMFNVKARSKVGASGIWQFMPGTARTFIRVNALVDERNNPYKATAAAAQLLATNYHELGTWPLAITAYNHGRVGMERAIRRLATDDIGAIIERYDSQSFGFASRNFYAEFLAAADTFERLIHQGKAIQPIALAATDVFVLRKPISVAQILRLTPLTKAALAEYNPDLRDQALSTHARQALPLYFELHVPRDLASAVRTALGAATERIARR